MGQDIQEWTKRNLWNKTFKKFEVIWSVSADHIISNFQRLSSTNFNVEYFFPYVDTFITLFPEVNASLNLRTLLNYSYCHITVSRVYLFDTFEVNHLLY